MNGPTQGAHSSTELFCVRGAQIFSLLFCLFCLFNNRNHKDDLDLTMPYLYLSYCSFVLGPRASWPVLHPSCFPLPLHSKQTVFLSLIETTDTISKIIILEQNPAVTPWGSLLTLISTDISPWNACMSLSYRRAFCILLQPCAVKAFHGLQGCSVTVLLCAFGWSTMDITNVSLGSYAEPTLIQACCFQGRQGQPYSKFSSGTRSCTPESSAKMNFKCPSYTGILQNLQGWIGEG